MSGSSVQPLVPAVYREDQVHDLKACIGVETGAEEKNREEGYVHDCRRPADDILARAQVDADDPEHYGNKLETARAVCLEPGADHHRLSLVDSCAGSDPAPDQRPLVV